ncbi:MAG: cytochrome c biogenesis protein CcsA, partial [Verrucomicrobiota bacterium]
VASQPMAERESAGIAREIKLYDQKPISNAKVFFIAGFLLMLVSWARPSSLFGKLTATGGLWFGIFGTFALIYGMMLRSQIRGWAWVTNLYETFLFIALGGFIFGVLFEFFSKRKNRIAISVGLFLPALCLLLAGQFEKLDPSDTLPPLVAVLRSNFWLTTHVLTITLGYAAGLLASFVSMIWIFGKIFRLNTDDKRTYRDITQMAYGIILFSLLFSLIGTVLGGIWANYSWGRFWGWDPKENGALMIVLWTLLILHARLGGYIRDLGIHACSIVLGTIIGFSWFGVNALGVGLHSYGFAAGIWQALCVFWGVQGVFLLGAIWLKVREHLPQRTEARVQA